jgi:hypothetical protein
MKITSILLVLVLLMIPFTGALAKEGPGNGKEGNGNGKAKVSSRVSG